VERHSQATAVRIVWRCDGERALIDVTDNGVGFDHARAGRVDSYGVLGMRERASSIGARLEIVSAPGRGTRVRCSLVPSETEVATDDDPVMVHSAATPLANAAAHVSTATSPPSDTTSGSVADGPSAATPAERPAPAASMFDAAPVAAPPVGSHPSSESPEQGDTP
jgi:hypothetical protein